MQEGVDWMGGTKEVVGETQEWGEEVVGETQEGGRKEWAGCRRRVGTGLWEFLQSQ